MTLATSRQVMNVRAAMVMLIFSRAIRVDEHHQGTGMLNILDMPFSPSFTSPCTSIRERRWHETFQVTRMVSRHPLVMGNSKSHVLYKCLLLVQQTEAAVVDFYLWPKNVYKEGQRKSNKGQMHIGKLDA